MSVLVWQASLAMTVKLILMSVPATLVRGRLPVKITSTVLVVSVLSVTVEYFVNQMTMTAVQGERHTCLPFLLWVGGM